jgi:ferredoxin
MIFYFSATGNSKYVAERIAAATDDHLVFLRDVIRSRGYQFDVSREKRIGFVCPTYYLGLPSIMTFFLEKLRLTGYTGQYVYLVLTCGGTTGNAAGQLAKALSSHGITLSAQFGVPMVDNYIPLYPIPEQEELEATLDGAEEYIDEARRVIRAFGTGNYNRCQGKAPHVATAVAYKAYQHGRSTKPFVLGDNCIRCGLCQEICPCGAISLSAGKPFWGKKRCVQCLGCLHRCPVRAIHWKKAEEDKGRYYNPRVEP